MSTMKIKFRSSADAGGEGVIYYQITKDKKVRRILTDYHVYPEEWDASRSMVTPQHRRASAGCIFFRSASA